MLPFTECSEILELYIIKLVEFYLSYTVVSEGSSRVKISTEKN